MYQHVEFYLRYSTKGQKTISHIELGLWPRTAVVDLGTGSKPFSGAIHHTRGFNSFVHQPIDH
jgi:hypothetical protein